MERMLSELLPDVTLPRDVPVKGITDDSRAVEPGWLFIAVPGLSVDGRKYIADAVSRAAAAVFCEPPVPASSYSIPVVAIPDLVMARGEIASRFFGNPSASMRTIAVTGTNGKTSCSHFIAAALQMAGTRCGVIGTLGFGMPGHLDGATLTTPDAISLQRRLADLKSFDCDAVAIEASSHGLVQGRLNGTSIDVGVFTNITRDHLDYHQTFEDYKQAKQRLFTWPGLTGAVINRDDEFAGELIASVAPGVDVVTYGVRDRQADVRAESLSFRPDGFDMKVAGPWGTGEVSSSLVGEFNASNLLAVISVLGLLDVPFDDALGYVSGLRNVPGRMDVMRRAGMATVVIDYAHTPDALEKALVALRVHTTGDLWCVVGCGGDRDKGKRPLMGRIAAEKADKAIITDDNPRSEPSAEIISQIVAGVSGGDVQVEPDRSKAIRHALEAAAPEDIVLIAGKGHEDYQEVNGKRLPFSDFTEVEKLFAESGNA
ncbi:MAG TPA: UDP-N-acetylmuramoyl-L-alanyl-D-glutamate--2,6-diaminopimelate ligase [Pseudomonadales bacterium]|nr:UDP-N-acetylmuramoyl-L-alanyl-D-glutamate--2,6-diaminopimelate ligase [Pseudomonadales bacterium]